MPRAMQQVMHCSEARVLMFLLLFFLRQGVASSNQDECLMGTHVCSEFSTCQDTVDSFLCICISGYEAKNLTKDNSTDGRVVCTDVDECMTHSHRCDVGANCTNTIGGYLCSCNDGYSWNGSACANIDECESDPCHSNATCMDTNGSFACACDLGFKGDGRDCKVDTRFRSIEPTWCSTLGEEPLSLSLINPPPAQTKLILDFRDGSTSVLEPSSLSDQILYMGSCPLRTSSGPAIVSLQILESREEVLNFSFAYRPAQVTVFPDMIPLTGSNTTLSMHGPPPGFAQSCVLTIGGKEAFVSAPTTSESLLAQGPGWVTVSIEVPSAQAPGPAAIAVSCLGFLGVYVEYVAPQEVTEVLYEVGRGCPALRSCSLLVSLAHPPASVRTANDLVVSVFGTPVLPRPGSSDAAVWIQIHSLTREQLVLVLLFPPFPSAGNFSATIAAASHPASIPRSFSASTVSIHVLPPVSRILGVSPDPIRQGSGSKVQILIDSIAPLASASDFQVQMGDTDASGLEVLASDIAGTLLSVDPPSLEPGVVEVRVLDLRSRVLVRAAVIVQRSIVEVRCVSGCEPELSGGLVVLEVDDTDGQQASDVNVSFDGTALVVVHAENTGRAIVLHAEIPPISIADVQDPTAVRYVDVEIQNEVVPVRLLFRAPPRVQVATFTGEGRAIVLQLDQAGEAFPAMRADCSNVVDAASLRKLGDAPSCSWPSAREIAITVGADATVQVGDVLNVTAELRLVNGTDHYPAGMFRVQAPRVVEAPVLSLSGPAEVGGCEEAVLSAMAFVARPRYQWAALNDAAVNDSIASVSGPEILLPPHLIREGETVDIMVTATSIFGAVSRPIIHSISRRADPVPLVQIDARPPPYLPSNLLIFTASAFPSRCAPGLTAPFLNFSWTVTHPASPDPILTSPSSVLRIQPGVLQAGQAYTATLAVAWRFEVDDPEAAEVLHSLVGQTVASKQLAIDHSPLVARIAGGDRKVSRHSSVLLDASQSLDPDLCDPAEGLLRQQPCPDPELKFLWVCKLPDGSFCRNASSQDAVVLPTLSQFPLNVSSLDLRTFRAVHLTVSVLKGARVRQASVGLEVVEGASLEVEMETVHYSATRVWLVASVSANDSTRDSADLGRTNLTLDPTFEWGLEWAGRGVEQQLASGGLLPDDAVETGWKRPNLVLNLARARMRAVVGSGGAFAVRVLCRLGDRAGEATVHLRIGQGPSGGRCWTAPRVAVAYAQEVVTSCAEWVAEDLPLQFRFGADAGSWTPWSFVGHHSGVFPAGTHHLRATVRDAMGAAAVSNWTAVHVHEQVVEAASSEAGLASAAERWIQMVGETVEGLRRVGRLPALLQVSALIIKALESDADEPAALQATQRRSLFPAGNSTLTPSFSDEVDMDWTREWSVDAGFAPGRRLLASSAAYQIRVRRMLIRAAAQASRTQSSRLTSMAILETSSALASEPEQVLEAEALAQLVGVASGYVLPDELRNGGMEEGLRATDRLIGACATLDQNEIDAVMLSALRSLKRLSLSYTSSMDPAERPFISNAAPLLPVALVRLPESGAADRNATHPFIRLNGSFGSISLSAAPIPLDEPTRGRRFGGMGLLVLRSASQWRFGELEQVSGGPRLVSEVAGVMLLDDARIQVQPPLQVGAVGDDPAYRCPDHDQRCVHVDLDVSLPAGAELGSIGVVGRNVGALACWRWSFANWNRGNCSLSDLALDLASGAGSATCNCNLDGLIVVAFSPHTVFRSDVVRVTARVARRHLIQPLIFMVVLAAAVGAVVAGVCWFVQSMSRLDFPAFRAKSGWDAFCWVELALVEPEAVLHRVYHRRDSQVPVSAAASAASRPGPASGVRWHALQTSRAQRPELFSHRRKEDGHADGRCPDGQGQSGVRGLRAGWLRLRERRDGDGRAFEYHDKDPPESWRTWLSDPSQLAEGHWNWFHEPVLNAEYQPAAPRFRYLELGLSAAYGAKKVSRCGHRVVQCCGLPDLLLESRFEPLRLDWEVSHAIASGQAVAQEAARQQPQSQSRAASAPSLHLAHQSAAVTDDGGAAEDQEQDEPRGHDVHAQDDDDDDDDAREGMARRTFVSAPPSPPGRVAGALHAACAQRLGHAAPAMLPGVDDAYDSGEDWTYTC